MEKKKVALHIIMPNQVSGPNVANKRMASSWLKEEFEFDFVTQTFLAKSRVNLALIWDLRRQLKAFQPDIVHLSGMQSSGFHAVVAARLAGCRNIVIAIRGFSGDAIQLGKLKRFLFTSVFEPLSLKLCSKFYTVCEAATEKKMVQRNKQKFLGVIHNAAPVITIDVEKERRKTREELFVKETDFLVVISGRMVYDKGLSFILEAIQKMKHSEIKFVFVGTGPFYEMIQEQFQQEIVQRKIILLGQREDVLHVLAGCDLFLFATLHENLSNALLEAMAIGLPVVATSVGGNREVVEDGRNGFLIMPENSEEITEKVTTIYEDFSLQQTFAAESVKIIAERFSQEKLYQSVADIYHSFAR